jgi:hypothetical protein
MLEILRVGTHIDSAGAEFSFSPQDLSDIAAGYDLQKYRSPVLRGHDENQPALAIVARLRVVGDSLFAILMNVSPELQTMLEQGQFGGVSVALYPPGEPSSPYDQDKWGLRHVALVQVPAVKGMALPQFKSSDRAVYINFAEAPEQEQTTQRSTNKQSQTQVQKQTEANSEANQETELEIPESLPEQMALVLANVRQFMLDLGSEAKGDRYLPESLIKAIEQSFASSLKSMAETKPNGEPGNDSASNANNVNNREASQTANNQSSSANQARQTDQSSASSESSKSSSTSNQSNINNAQNAGNTDSSESEAELTEISDRLAQLKQQEEALRQRQQELAQREQSIKKAEFEEFLESLIRDGKLLPSEKQTLLELMMALPDAPAPTETAQFSEAGDHKSNSQPSAIATFKKSLSDRPRFVTFGEIAGRTSKFTPVNETRSIQDQAQAYIAEQKAIGNEVSVSEAVAIVLASS